MNSFNPENCPKAHVKASCGTGYFTKKAIERGAIVTSVYIAEKLVKLAKNRSPQALAISSS